MKNRSNKNISILFIFFILILSVPIFWIITGGDLAERSIIEGRKLTHFSLFDRGYYSALSDLLRGNVHTFTEVINDQFVERDFQQDLEIAATDQFPFREKGLVLSRWYERLGIFVTYALLDDPAIPTDMRSDIFITRDKSRFITAPDIFNDSVKQIVDKRIENYVLVIQQHPELNIYAFYFERLANSIYNPLNVYYPSADKGRAFTYFEENMPADIKLSKFMLSSYDEFDSLYYKTDHHWNIHGDLKAYYLIHTLLKRGYPNISPPVQIKGFFTFPDIEYLGTTARLSLYPIKGEPFEVALYDLPFYRTYIDGIETQRNLKDNYLNGNYMNDEPYTDHFVEYFGHVSPFVEYEFSSNNDKNLLMIGKSFNIPLEPLIASHYHHTYVIDLRYFENFSLSKFLENHRVDDLLIIGDNDVLFDNPDWAIRP